MIHAYMLLTGDDGNTHMQEGSIELAQLVPMKSIQFKQDPPHSSSSWHNAPTPQFVLSLTGVVEVTTKAGQRFTVRPGEVMIAADQVGSGHNWRLVDDEPWTRAYIAYEPGVNLHFDPDATAASID